jgi:hypothetical protein
MKLARYVGGGRIEIRDEPEPTLPPGGLIVKTEASGLCSGELMDWYMERKVPHVLGHEDWLWNRTIPGFQLGAGWPRITMRRVVSAFGVAKASLSTVRNGKGPS